MKLIHHLVVNNTYVCEIHLEEMDFITHKRLHRKWMDTDLISLQGYYTLPSLSRLKLTRQSL
jgi:hypothetical protein